MRRKRKCSVREGGVSIFFVTSEGGCAGGIARVPAQHKGSHKVERRMGSVDALDAACSPAAQTRSYEALYCREHRQRRTIHGRNRSRGRKDSGRAGERVRSECDGGLGWVGTIAFANVCARQGKARQGREGVGGWCRMQQLLCVRVREESKQASRLRLSLLWCSACLRLGDERWSLTTIAKYYYYNGKYIL